MEKRTEVSPVVCTWDNILKLYCPSERISLYSYLEDFEELWKLFDLKSSITDLSKTFFIVWDGIPSRQGKLDKVYIDKYLTPLDWALAFSIYVLDSVDKKNPIYPDLKIIIFNLSSKSFTESDSLQYVDQFPKRDITSMPWIRVFSPGDGNQYWNIEDLFDTLAGREEIPVCSMKDVLKKKPDLSLLKNMWAAFLTRPSSAPADRHAIANMVGPLLLAKNYKADIQVRAISYLMKAIGLLPYLKDEKALLEAGKPWIDWNNGSWNKRLSELIEGGGRLNILLVDDQHEQGWGQILCMALGVHYKPDNKDGIIGSNKSIIIKASKSTEILERKLTGEDQRFRLSFSDDNEVLEILFLDLRLFP